MLRCTWRHSLALASFVLLALVTFAPQPVAAQADTGSADFSRHVVIGDSLAAGIVSGGWLDQFQANTFPSLIHRQATGTTAGFEQPLVGSPGITPPLRLDSLSPLILGSAGGLGSPTNLLLPRPYNNLAVPGFDVSDTVDLVTDNGGLGDLVLRGQGTQLQQAAFQQPTFSTVWIGNNDVLGAATSGLVIEGLTITPVDVFDQKYRTIIGTLAAVGSSIVVATVPDVAAIPFVSTVPPILVDPATSEPVVVNGSFVPLLGPDGPLSLGDSVLLTGNGLLAQGFGVPTAFGGNGLPLPNEVVLSAGEKQIIRDRTNVFNDIIRGVAGEAGASVVETAALFDRTANEGIDIAGINFNADFLTGGVVSYDGVHPTPFGYAYIANEFINVINRDFGANIPEVNLRPFVFGQVSLIPGAGIAAVSSAQAKGAQFSERALENLNLVGVPVSLTTGVVRPETPAEEKPPAGGQNDDGDAGGAQDGDAGGHGSGGAADGGDSAGDASDGDTRGGFDRPSDPRDRGNRQSRGF
ncbi:MAG: SGNH/GDSL hydrolase family protein [Acidobacteriota bacterium]